MKGLNYRLCIHKGTYKLCIFFLFPSIKQCVFDVSMSIRLSQLHILSHLHKVMLWCEREMLHAKNVITKGAHLNDCWIQLASQLILFAQSHIFYNINETKWQITFSGFTSPPPTPPPFFKIHNHKVWLKQGCTNMGPPNPKWPSLLLFVWWCQISAGPTYETFCMSPSKWQ